tara:strand:+ start:1087 stop:2076 length:990 start_codon:yes stop_codon:yes gene_type:complete
MMNEFGVPMGDAEMNMLKNPAKAAMQANITAGKELQAWWVLPLAIASVGAQVYGANKASNAAKDQANLQNEATERQHGYDLELWDMTKERIQDDRQFAAEEIQTKAANERTLAEYKDATNLANYGYQLQIRNREQQSLDNQYIRSQNIYGLQTTLNSDTARSAREDELRKLQEINAESAFQLQERQVEQMQAEGTLRARGATGRTAGKLVQSNLADLGRQMAQLNESMEAAGRNTRAVLKDIQRDKTSADLTAYANRMLAPGVLPQPVAPIQTPLAEYLMPRPLTDADFGPRPVKGAYVSPSAASSKVWGSSISSIAGTVGGFATAKMG